MFRRTISTLTSLTLVASLTMGGCGSDEQPGPEASSSVQPGAGESTVLEATVQTRAESGIDYWELDVGDGELRMVAFDAQGASRGWVEVREWSDGGEGGKQVKSSGGGLLRLDASGQIRDLVDDPHLFPAFARDSELLQEGEQFRGCGVFAWLGCAGAVLGVIAACGPAGIKCAAAILGTGKCFECFLGGGGDGPVPGPGPGNVPLLPACQEDGSEPVVGDVGAQTELGTPQADPNCGGTQEG